MATIIQRDISPDGGNVSASVWIASMDPNDEILARQYGDIYVNPSGLFTDTEDPLFSFTVNVGGSIGIMLSPLEAQRIFANFDDDELELSVKLRQASLWTLAIANSIASGIAKLRTNQESISGIYTMTV